MSIIFQGSFDWLLSDAGPFPVSCLYQLPPLLPGTPCSVCVFVCVCMFIAYSLLALLPSLLLCKQALIVSCVTCCRATNVQAWTFRRCHTTAALFYRPLAAPPRVFLEWHHTVTAVLASTHLPIIAHTSYSGCSWNSRSGRIMNRVRPNLPAWKNNII